MHRLDELRLRGGDFIQFFDFSKMPAVGAITLGPLQRLRLTLTAEPSVVNLRTPHEHALDMARERMRSNLVRLPKEIDDLAASIEDLVSARVALALRVHCDADHDFDD